MGIKKQEAAKARDRRIITAARLEAAGIGRGQIAEMLGLCTATLSEYLRTELGQEEVARSTARQEWLLAQLWLARQLDTLSELSSLEILGLLLEGVDIQRLPKPAQNPFYDRLRARRGSAPDRASSRTDGRQARRRPARKAYPGMISPNFSTKK